MDRRPEPEGAEPGRFAALYAWQPQDGTQPGPLRGSVLRLLKPFTDRQDAINISTAQDIERLALEVERLQRRVLDAEQHEGRAHELPESQLSTIGAPDGPVGIGPEALTGPADSGGAWSVPEGARLRTLRGALLWMVQPFAGRQNEVNDRRARSLEKTMAELGLARRQLEAIERSRESET